MVYVRSWGVYIWCMYIAGGVCTAASFISGCGDQFLFSVPLSSHDLLVGKGMTSTTSTSVEPSPIYRSMG